MHLDEFSNSMEFKFTLHLTVSDKMCDWYIWRVFSLIVVSYGSYVSDNKCWTGHFSSHGHGMQLLSKKLPELKEN